MNAIAHSAFPVVPGRIGNITDAYLPSYWSIHEITSDYRFPPAAVLSCALTYELQIAVSLTYGGCSISSTTTIAGAYFDWKQRLAAWSVSTNTHSLTDSDSSGLENLSVYVFVGDSTDFYFGYNSGKWSLPVRVRVTASDGVSEDGDYRIGDTSGTAIGSSYGGVTVTAFGESLALYDYDGASNSSPTGTITLTPLSWLEP